MCTLSVIVPLYNGAHTIERCLDSLCGQTIKDIEILVVDDGSLDQGADIVKRYMANDKRIKLFAQKNQGAGAARNLGISKAEGKYVGFVDCDDFADTDMFRIMVEALERTKTPVAVCQEKNVYAENGEIQLINETRFPVDTETVYSSEDVLKWLLNYTYMSLNSLCYKVVEKRIFTEYHIEVPYPHRQGEDLVASVGILTHVNEVVVVPESLYYYVHRKDSVSYAYSLKHARDIYLDWKEARTYIQKTGRRVNTDNFSLGMYFSSMKQLQWMKQDSDKRSEQARMLRKKWKAARRHYRWKPDFAGTEVPVMHKIKILSAYFHLCRPVLAGMQCLKWIPMFKYLA
ncbi:hypothetical protein BRYFOR_07390 [Marvinbryantia formatexigens DSM 14469]|uniref:Glycosyltransferase 2-like domain-containing protein n=1 Tax=Marvinbryantia formatexigens DSM 14469 TaxID=478749 RepID=C6LFI7_9FIRM|nr:glycosyltransferase [Marvinbryantia formatexigens]EET60572.1 hypothetical protein BRYFOR_07390 [Marvinbryantia formatexigens DSM 14469]UWO25567.1 glycosyltransferase [Marvinbryantia formatexigens DSM 14469]SDG19507.1 Glycosyltransferase involved in cell wall bisynthesis [Marvinbryantia formatexigens]